MPMEDLGRLRAFRFSSLGTNGVVHAIFSRRGGVSPAPWASLNVGATVGDDADRVRANRRSALEALGRTGESVFDAWQVHSAEVIIAAAPRGAVPPPQADAILTDRPEVTLMMRFADCVPVLLYDPVRRAVGIVHTGWLGTVRQVVGRAIREMHTHFGTDPADVLAGIGPSIGPDHYPVGPEVVEALRTSFGASAEQHLRATSDAVHLDLWSANEQLLREAGVTQIEVAGLCSACHVDDWYSHRGESGRTGRFGALIALST
jgi:YfiH family protein